MKHEITINGFEFTIELLNTGRWNKEDEMFEDVQWKVVDGFDLEEGDFESEDYYQMYIHACWIVEPAITDHSDEMEYALQEACKKEATICTN